MSNANWQKYQGNPVLGGELGTCFDVAVIRDSNIYRMYFSWRPKRSIAMVESSDGLTWSEPRIVLGPNPESGWEDNINRPGVVKRDDGYHMWYTGQTKEQQSFIGYAASIDGTIWQRMENQPCLVPEFPWEKVAVMCPHVLWSEDEKLFRMWYSGGEQFEPNAIGYATSANGLSWTRYPTNPVFKADPNTQWEQHKVTACQVVHHHGRHVMFYIGFEDDHTARIGLARSRDGISGWERHPANPIVSPTPDAWDGDACYKPFSLFDPQQNRWILWYNGRKGGKEQIGVAFHVGEDLGVAC